MLPVPVPLVGEIVSQGPPVVEVTAADQLTVDPVFVTVTAWLAGLAAPAVALKVREAELRVIAPGVTKPPPPPDGGGAVVMLKALLVAMVSPVLLAVKV